ncbi:lamin tail domain-containing protein [Haloarcula japonica]|uniref:Endonuclease nuclease-like protein n=1 Tax=Haloarcula japonica (strain ATCC 49778 / DSM 6131 / JCM 7785 / NBRC 101032 / NCIMB 13157 / TR-1) TaxID=1227453 RepID=M0L749_HALJT|nr:lamin tail domain-containing protein [Haloarcula japonica]EMA28918.1 endonuclease nuclease-like protein [Haloarcula japonica DSM 6131]
MRRLTFGFVVVLVVAAGCSGFTGEPSGSAGTAVDGQSAVDVPESAVTVTVTAVVDGDTIQVAYENGTGDTVRLVGVDTPEVHAENDPAEFEGVPETDAGASCLRGAGTNASSLAKQRLLGETVGLAFDPNLNRRGYYDRLLAYVVHDEALFNYRLVETGHARVYDSEFTRAERFYAAEDAARSDRRGLWRCTDQSAGTRTAIADGGTASAVAVADVHADAEDNDNENLNDEYITLTNAGDAPVDLSGWTVSDAAGHQYTFANLTLDPNASVTLYTGSGTDTGTERYWGRDGAVWNNDGDTVIVRNASGETILRQSY